MRTYDWRQLNTLPSNRGTHGVAHPPGEEPGARSKANNPMGREGQMSELQNLATFLLSNGCDWLNGESIMMDGGNALATGGNFYALREWTDAQWQEARDRIEAQNKKDREQRA